MTVFGSLAYSEVQIILYFQVSLNTLWFKFVYWMCKRQNSSRFLTSTKPISNFTPGWHIFYMIARTKLGLSIPRSWTVLDNSRKMLNNFILNIYATIHFKLFSYPCHRNKIYCIHVVKYNTDSQWIQIRHPAVHLP